MITRMLGIPEIALAGYAKSFIRRMTDMAGQNSYLGFCEARE